MLLKPYRRPDRRYVAVGGALYRKAAAVAGIDRNVAVGLVIVRSPARHFLIYAVRLALQRQLARLAALQCNGLLRKDSQRIAAPRRRINVAAVDHQRFRRPIAVRNDKVPAVAAPVPPAGDTTRRVPTARIHIEYTPGRDHRAARRVFISDRDLAGIPAPALAFLADDRSDRISLG